MRETITETAKDKTVTTYTLDFAYDAQGTPYSLTVTMQGVSLTYYYITNLQGDVMYLIDASKNTVASYDYDPYGKIIEANDYSTQTYAQKPTEPEDTTKTLAELNPLRYRGYYYDNDDVGFYYLQSRYYDASTCRFISADEYASTGQGFNGYNMFAYCGNNPTERKDMGGEFWNLVIGAVVGGIAGAVTQIVTNVKEGNNITDGLVSATLVGAAEGLVASTGLSVLGQAGVSAVISGVGSMAQQIADTGSFSWKKVGKDALMGGAMSLLGSGAGALFDKGVTHFAAKSEQLFEKHLLKHFTSEVNKAAGKSWSSLAKQATKYLAKSNFYLNCARGTSSVVGSGVGSVVNITINLACSKLSFFTCKNLSPWSISSENASSILTTTTTTASRRSLRACRLWFTDNKPFRLLNNFCLKYLSNFLGSLQKCTGPLHFDNF